MYALTGTSSLNELAKYAIDNFTNIAILYSYLGVELDRTIWPSIDIAEYATIDETAFLRSSINQQIASLSDGQTKQVIAQT